MQKQEAIVAIKHLTAELNRHNYLYYVCDTPEISDYEFDQLLKQLELMEKEWDYQEIDSPTQRVGGFVTKNFETAAHLFPMLSLSNVYSLEELNEFVTRNIKNAEESFSYTCEPKYDGVAISLVYENGVLVRAVTRGDGNKGDVVTANVRTIKSVPLRLQGNDFPKIFEMRGEIILPFDTFEKINIERDENGLQPFANPRNAASGTLKMQDSSIVASRQLECMPYFFLSEEKIAHTHAESMHKAKSWGFKIPPYLSICNNIEEVKSYLKEWETKKDQLPFAIDGAVIKINEYQIQESLGMTVKSPRWAVAYKYKAEQAATALLSVDFQVGRTGVVTPVANLSPVLISGTVVKRASLHNADIISKFDLREHDVVYVEKGGEIIPKITGVDVSQRKENANPVEFIQFCPECGTKLIRFDGEVAWICPNEKYCPPQIKGKIEHFISRKAMNIDSLGEGKIELLFDKGKVNNIADIYDLEYQSLIGLEKKITDEKSGKEKSLSFKEKTVENILNGINNSKNVPFEQVLYALGIKFVGETVAKKIAREVKSMKKLQQMSTEELQTLPEVGEKTALAIKKWLDDEENISIINRLEKAGLSMEILSSQPSNIDQRFLGKKIIVSGSIPGYTRDQLIQMIEALGAQYVSSISSKTDIVIVGENMGPSKKESAERLNIPMIAWQDFFNLLEKTEKSEIDNTNRSGASEKNISVQGNLFDLDMQ